MFNNNKYYHFSHCLQLRLYKYVLLQAHQHSARVICRTQSRKMAQKDIFQFFGGSSKKCCREETLDQNLMQPKPKFKRKFRPEWLKDFEWLSYDDESDLMYCTWCQDWKKNKRAMMALYLSTG